MSGEQKVVAAGALLQCSAGASTSVMIATSAATVAIEGKVLVTTMDYQPIANIPPFGVCSITGKQCVPSLPGPWVPSLTGVSIGASPLLPYGSTLQCAFGGNIFVLDCNQNSTTFGGPERPELPEEKQASGRPALPELPERPHFEPWSPEEKASSDALKDRWVLLFPHSKVAQQYQKDLEAREESALRELSHAEKSLEAAKDALTLIRYAAKKEAEILELQRQVRNAQRVHEMVKRAYEEARARAIRMSPNRAPAPRRGR